MSSTYSSLHYHLVFSTKHREPWIDATWRPRLHDYLGGMVRGFGGQSLGVGGVSDHVHLLVNLKPTHCLSDFVRDLKKDATHWVRQNLESPSFSWQEGYAAITVSPSGLTGVQNYIRNQEKHHQRISFKDELLTLLQKAQIKYDERYLE